MILYFSGTGNSQYIAEKIGERIQDETRNLFKKIREQDFSPMTSRTPWVVVAPTYAWRLPHIVSDWLKRAELRGNSKVYFVMTCGGSIGNAGAYCEKVCRSKQMQYQGCMEVLMPENYIALFRAPGQEEALKIIRKSSGRIEEAAGCIRDGRPFSKRPVSFQDRMSSGIVNDIFYPAVVHAKKFYATEACISCGKCEAVCPLKNVKLENGKPLWGKDCTHCMACICRCPKEAIEYGKRTKGMVRYTFPER